MLFNSDSKSDFVPDYYSDTNCDYNYDSDCYPDFN